jgi:hypothetical protein
MLVFPQLPVMAMIYLHRRPELPLWPGEVLEVSAIGRLHPSPQRRVLVVGRKPVVLALVMLMWVLLLMWVRLLLVVVMVLLLHHCRRRGLVSV